MLKNKIYTTDNAKLYILSRMLFFFVKLENKLKNNGIFRTSKKVPESYCLIRGVDTHHAFNFPIFFAPFITYCSLKLKLNFDTCGFVYGWSIFQLKSISRLAFAAYGVFLAESQSNWDLA